MDVVRGEEGKAGGAARRGFDARSIARALRNPQVIDREYDRCMRITMAVLGILLAAAGLVWIAQGLNLPFAPRSFMTADRTWIVLGAIAALAGAVLVGWARQHPR
jgi:hypothetical protein